MKILITPQLASRIRAEGTVDTEKYRYRVLPDGTIERLPLECLNTPDALTAWAEVEPRPMRTLPARSRTTLAALKYAGFPIAKVAAQKGYTRAALSKKITEDRLSNEEMQEIAAIIGAEFIPGKFRFPDGTEF